MLVQVYAGDTADANNLKRMSFVDVNNLFVQKDVQYGYNTPCWTVDGMTYGTYTVVVRYVKGTTYGLPAIDGFRVTNTLNPSDATTSGFYADVYEANMQTAEIRNMVLKQADVNNAIFEMSAPMYQVGVNEVLMPYSMTRMSFPAQRLLIQMAWSIQMLRLTKTLSTLARRMRFISRMARLL